MVDKATSVLNRELDAGLIAGCQIPPPSLLKLTAENEAETLKFLAARPIHTVYVAGLIADNGVASPANRGTIYGCRNRRGGLEGVALIGHATIIETESDDCIEKFALVARSCSPTHLIRGEREKVKAFWNYYSDAGYDAPLLCRELLLRRQTITTKVEVVPSLRQATLADLEMIVTVNASLALQESGTNPLAKDTVGFRERCARRIRQGRSWLLTENNQLIFKADIVGQTPQAAYVEGVYVNPEKRRQGYGFRCLSQLSEHLLRQVGSICLTVNEKSSGALTFYQRSGFYIASSYDTIYLDR